MDPAERRRLRYRRKRRRDEPPQNISDSESDGDMSEDSTNAGDRHEDPDQNDGQQDGQERSSESDDTEGNQVDIEEAVEVMEQGAENVPSEDEIPSPPGSMLGSDSEGEEFYPSEVSESEEEGRDVPSEEEGEQISESEPEDQEASDESDNDDNDEANAPIYPGAPITLLESLLAIFTFMSVEQVSGKLMTSILKLIALHCPAGNILKKTLYTFKKFFKNIAGNVLIFHYFCDSCIYPLDTKESVCPKCRAGGKASFFIELPLLYQLQLFFKRNGFFEHLQFRFQENRKHCAENIEDIYDGQIYKEEMANGGFLSNPSNLSFMWYSDGLQTFKSSFFSIWPICLVINELPYKMRTHPDNILLVGLWFGRSKPSPNIFLKPLKKTMSQFEKTGHSFKLHDNTEVKVKGKILCGTCDMPAKCKFLLFKQFNAAFGCPYCMEAGGRATAGKTTVQVYPYRANIVRRTHQQTKEFAQQALEARATDKKASINGVKGPSILSHMVPDLIRCTAIDVMHGVFLGVCKLVVNLIFSSTYSTQPWSVHHLLDVLDEKLRKIKPPSYVQRTPRSLKDLKLWKAAEFKYFLLYYSVPLLKGIMEDVYLKHHCLLVSAISLLSKNSISMTQINAAREMLNSYVNDFARLYSLRFLGINVHQLLHLPDVVFDLGPLFVYSCFFLESFNGKINRLFHGTQHIALQICSSMSMLMQVPILIARLPQNSKALEFCHKVKESSRSFKLADVIDMNTFAVGTYSRNNPQLGLTIQILELSQNVVNGNHHLFYRLKRKGTMYYAKEYALMSTKKESSFVKFLYNNRPLFGQILRFVRMSACDENCEVYCRNCPVSYYAIIQEYERAFWFVHDMRDVKLPHICKVNVTENIVAVEVQFIECLCFNIIVDTDMYIATPVNSLEVE